VKFNLDCLKKLRDFYCNFFYTTQAIPIKGRDINFLQIGWDVSKFTCVI
jgi:hypothetical protein